MIRLRIKELLEGRSIYWLAEQTGIKYPGLWKIVKKGTTSVHFKTLDSICRVLECPLGELLVRDEDQVGPKRRRAKQRKGRKSG